MSAPDRPLCLDLFCGAGGATKGLQRAGFHVTGVDIKPQPRYCGDVFHQADAMEFPLDGFDFIWASPPCQAFTSMKVMPNAKQHLDLLTPTRQRLQEKGTPYAMENVVGAPIEVSQPSFFSSVMGIILCGSMFDLQNGSHELRRHRLFESSVPLRQPPCRHRLQSSVSTEITLGPGKGRSRGIGTAAATSPDRPQNSNSSGN